MKPHKSTESCCTVLGTCDASCATEADVAVSIEERVDNIVVSHDQCVTLYLMCAYSLVQLLRGVVME